MKNFIFLTTIRKHRCGVTCSGCQQSPSCPNEQFQSCSHKQKSLERSFAKSAINRYHPIIFVIFSPTHLPHKPKILFPFSMISKWDRQRLHLIFYLYVSLILSFSPNVVTHVLTKNNCISANLVIFVNSEDVLWFIFSRFV